MGGDVCSKHLLPFELYCNECESLQCLKCATTSPCSTHLDRVDLSVFVRTSIQRAQLEFEQLDSAIASVMNNAELLKRTLTVMEANQNALQDEVSARFDELNRLLAQNEEMARKEIAEETERVVGPLKKLATEMVLTISSLVQLRETALSSIQTAETVMYRGKTGMFLQCADLVKNTRAWRERRDVENESARRIRSSLEVPRIILLENNMQKACEMVKNLSIGVATGIPPRHARTSEIGVQTATVEHARIVSSQTSLSGKTSLAVNMIERVKWVCNNRTLPELSFPLSRSSVDGVACFESRSLGKVYAWCEYGDGEGAVVMVGEDGVARSLMLGGHLRHPSGIAYFPNDDLLFVTDFETSEVARVELHSGDDLGRGCIFSDLSTGLLHPRGIAVDKNGRVFVADSGNDRIVILNRDLERVGEIGSEGATQSRHLRLDGPSAVVVHQGRIIVCDTLNNRIQIFEELFLHDALTFKFKTGFSFTLPRGIVSAPDGCFLVLGGDAASVFGLFDRSGVEIAEISVPTQYNGVAVNDMGRLVSVDSLLRRVVVF